jgi:hypothetical protein
MAADGIGPFPDGVARSAPATFGNWLVELVLGLLRHPIMFEDPLGSPLGGYSHLGRHSGPYNLC